MSATDTPSTRHDTEGEASAAGGSFDALLREVARPTEPAAHATRLPMGSVLAGGRLSILRRVGEGGMGIVYEAFDASRRTRVALKTLNRLNPANVYRLKNEFRSLADVRHPNLVRLHELFAENDTWFFTMELVAGERFDVWVRRSDVDANAVGVNEARLRDALGQLTQGVQAIHAAGKLHCDLKPSNVLVTAEGRVVILDFGLTATSERVDSHATAHARDAIRGTPAYMAPEQAAGRAATRASDVYALGVMLFEALTDRLPFSGAVNEILHDKQHRAPPCDTMLQHAPDDLRALCEGCLATDPGARMDLAAMATLLGVKEALSPSIAAQRAEGPPTLVGRADALAQLHTAFDAMESGTPVFLRLAADAGLGKTALVQAFANEVRRTRRCLVLSGRCHERENVPYKGVDALIDDVSRHLRALPHDEAAALLPGGVTALVRLFPVLARVPAVADLPASAQEVHEHEHQLQQRAFAALGELLTAMRDRQPLVLWIDDLQWTDPDSVRLMRFLLLHPTPPPLMMIGSHRREHADEPVLLSSLSEAAQSNRQIMTSEIELPALDATSLSTIVSSLFSHQPLDVWEVQAIAREARGNPRWAIELAQARVAFGTRNEGLTLQHTLTARIARLPTDAWELLSTIAVAAGPIAQGVVADAAGVATAHGVVDALVAERWLRVTASDAPTGRRVECEHEQMRALVVSCLTTEQVRQRSRRLAFALERLAGSSHELISRCWEQAGDLGRARNHARIAADQARAALAHDRAAQGYQRALDLGCDSPGEACQLRVALADALSHAGHGARAAEAYLRAAELAGASEVPALQRRAGEQYLLCGQALRGRRLLAEGLRPLGISLPLSSAGAIAAAWRSRLHYEWSAGKLARVATTDRATLGRIEALADATVAFSRTDPFRTADLNARCVMMARRHGHVDGYVAALGREVALAGLFRRTPREVEPIVREIEQLAARRADSMGRFWLHFGRGSFELTRAQPWSGDYAAALADFERASDLLRTVSSPTASYDAPWLQYQRANALTMLGRFSEASRIAQVQAEAAWARSELTLLPAWALTASYVRCALGEADQAAREVQRAQDAWQPDDLCFQDMMLPAAVMVLAAYRGEARVGWQTCEESFAKLRGRWLGRVVFGAVSGPLRAIWAAAAAAELPECAQRRDLVRVVEQACKKAQRWEPDLATNARAVLACARRDPDVAVAEMRKLLTIAGLTPTWGYATRRCLGVILGGDEGRALIAEADGFFRAGGVTDPERFTQAVLPGMVIR